jgi:hypothetical protein
MSDRTPGPQNSLLKYWEFQPFDDSNSNSGKHPRRQDSDATSDRTRVDPGSNGATAPSKSRWGFPIRKRGKDKAARASHAARTSQAEGAALKEKENTKPPKKVPVIFFDEAHKLRVFDHFVLYFMCTHWYCYRPALIKSTDAMKCLLDSMLVLTKQDRLCHVIHATSDPFYQTWLRQLNVVQHCKVCSQRTCEKK